MASVEVFCVGFIYVWGLSSPVPVPILKLCRPDPIPLEAGASFTCDFDGFVQSCNCKKKMNNAAKLEANMVGVRLYHASDDFFSPLFPNNVGHLKKTVEKKQCKLLVKDLN